MLAIWVLKQQVKRLESVYQWLHLARYMGIETRYAYGVFNITTLHLARYMGIETKRYEKNYTKIMLHLARYMGIETE